MIKPSPHNFLIIGVFAVAFIALARMGAARFGITGLTELIG